MHKLPGFCALTLLAVLLSGCGSTGTEPTTKPTATSAWDHEQEPLTRTTARRECRTAIEDEFQARDAARLDDENTVITSVQEIELQEIWKTADGYNVNGTVHFTLTAAYADPVTSTLSLTCVATGTELAPTTTVSNRGE